MPNHTENVLRVSGPKDELDRFERVCRGRSPQYAESEVDRKLFGPRREEPETCLTFSGVVPVPAVILLGTYDRLGYDWQTKHWGTKWDAYGPPELLRTENGSLVYLFRTAWCPPRPWLRAAAAKFPGLRFELFARDEYPYCVTIVADRYEDGPSWQECYGESVPKTEG